MKGVQPEFILVVLILFSLWIKSHVYVDIYCIVRPCIYKSNEVGRGNFVCLQSLWGPYCNLTFYFLLHRSICLPSSSRYIGKRHHIPLCCFFFFFSISLRWPQIIVSCWNTLCACHIWVYFSILGAWYWTLVTNFYLLLINRPEKQGSISIHKS